MHRSLVNVALAATATIATAALAQDPVSPLIDSIRRRLVRSLKINQKYIRSLDAHLPAGTGVFARPMSRRQGRSSGIGL